MANKTNKIAPDTEYTENFIKAIAFTKELVNIIPTIDNVSHI